MNFKKLNRWIEKHLPTEKSLQHNKFLRIFGKWLISADLWIFNVHSVSRGVAVGLFCGFMVFPIQSLPAVLLSIVMRANLPVAIFISFYANPLTLLPLMFFAYQVGDRVLDLPDRLIHPDFSLAWFTHEFLIIWKPLLLGSFICGLALALLGYLIVWIIYWIKRVRQARTLPFYSRFGIRVATYYHAVRASLRNVLNR